MKILVTGGSGFIGSNFIIDQINNSNNHILNFDIISYAANPKNLKKINNSKRYSFIKGDICNQSNIQEALINFKPNAVVHFAAESHVDRSINNPNQFIITNVNGTANLLDVCNRYYRELDNKSKKAFKFLHISTDEVFGSLGKKGFFNEKTSYSPNSPYSASKASSDHLVRAWNHTYNFPTLITNCSNNYGPYQFPEKLIPLMIANCFDYKPLPVYGEGKNIRDWLYVDDHCKALNLVLNYGEIGGTYNIGGNSEIKNIDIVKSICTSLDKLRPLKNSKKYSSLITFVKDRPGHDFRYAIDSTKIQNELNWKPLESFSSGLDKTIKWYIKNEIWWREIQKLKYSQERLGLFDE